MIRRFIKKQAFTLVEVTVALGIASFCLIAVFGLLPVGLNSNDAAINQTVTNGILSTIISDLQATPAASPVGSASVISSQFAITIPKNPIAADTPSVLYFTSEGKYTGTSLASNSRYKITVTFLKNTGDKSATQATLLAVWPAPAANPSGKANMFVALDRN